MKYLELFKDGFDSTIDEKIKPENYPYVGYSPTDGLRLSMIPEDNQIEYQMVDLGLPSGLKWADRNVGAETPQDGGLYFSWGNVDGHTADENGNVIDYLFDSTTYSTTLGGQYTGSELDAEHDAASVNMGDGWRMPTRIEIRELVKNTDYYFISEDDSIVSESELNISKKLRSICLVKKGEPFDYNNRSNFIEFPFSGNFNGSSLVEEGLRGGVWSSTVDTGNEDSARYFGFMSNGYLDYNFIGSSYHGRPVRGVHA